MQHPQTTHRNRLAWWKRDDEIITTSMRWWGGSIVQGFLYSLGPILLGESLLILYSITDETNMLLVAIGLLVVGLAYIGWYAAAPYTRKWDVIITDDNYYVVEDKTGSICCYLGPGLNRIPWHRNAWVRKFVDFNTVPVYEQFEGIRWADGIEGYIEIKMTLTFDPTQADPTMYEALRNMVQNNDFQRVIRNDLRDFVRYQSSILAWDEFQYLVGNSKTIQGAIVDGLEPLTAVGLMPSDEHPILILLDAVPSAVGQRA